jgi:Domain of unknown function (DUF4388)
MAAMNGQVTVPAFGSAGHRSSEPGGLRSEGLGMAGRPGGPGLQGAIEVIGAVGLLQMCHLFQLTGALEATRGTRTVRMTFEAGRLARASSEEAPGRDAVLEFLAWTDGHFAFQNGATADGEPISEPTDFLILEACRILDERSAAKVED